MSIPTSAPSDLDRRRECPDCGLHCVLPDTGPREEARCPRCGRVLHRPRRGKLDHALAWNLAATVFYALAVSLPFVAVHLSGRSRFCDLATGPEALEGEGFFLLGAIVFAFSIAAPLVKLLLTLVVLVGLRAAKPPRFLPELYRWLLRVRPWAMVEVYLLGLFIAYTRLVALTQVEIEAAVYALAGVMVASVASDAALDGETVWRTMRRRGLSYRAEVERRAGPGEAAALVGCHTCHQVNALPQARAAEGLRGERCHRCGGRLHRRKPESVARTWALLLAAALLYAPANLYPVMSTVKLGHELSHTILGGADELLEAGLWPLAALVFFASILVPMLKFISLTAMLVATHRRSPWRLGGRTRLYRALEFIGRWSMIDVFMISILVALVQFGKLASVTAGGGILAFALVVVLTMLATETFDPRLMWDRGEGR